MPSAAPFSARGWPLYRWAATSAAPTAPPASPAAGCSHRLSNKPCFSSLPLATQLSATPPARQRFFSPVSRGDGASQLEHHLLGHCLDRSGQIHFALGERRFGLARRGAEQRIEARVGHRQPGAVVEVVQIQPETAVVLDVDELLLDELEILRLAVGGEPHHLVFARVDLEAGVVGEGGIEQPERVGEVDLADDLQSVAFAQRQRRRRPFAHAVHRQHRRALERRGEEGAGGMAQVVLGEQQLGLASRRRRPRLFSSLTSRLFWNSFSLSQRGSACRNEVKPRGAKAR